MNNTSKLSFSVDISLKLHIQYDCHRSNKFVFQVDGVDVVFQPFDLSGQRIVHGNKFPLALRISKSNGEELSLDEGAKAIRD
jgi:hypothetical protein